MIRKNLINCKLIDEKRSGKNIIDEYMKHLQPGIETCPYCGSSGELHVHAYYGRTLIELIDGHPVKIRLNATIDKIKNLFLISNLYI